MKVKITARKFKAHPSLKEFVQAEVADFERYADDIHSLEVVLSFEKAHDSVKTAEIVTKVPGNIITATAQSDEFEKSIRAAAEKTITQLKKYRRKKSDH